MKPTSNAAKNSGLFAPVSTPTTTPIPTPEKQQTTTPKSKPSKKPDRKAKAPAEESQQSTADTPSFDWLQEQDVFVAIKAANSNSLQFQLARKITREFKRYARLPETSESGPRAENAGPVEELTVEELIERITKSLRDSRATPTDVKTLAQVLRELSPATFHNIDGGIPPDPCAIAETITGWAGKSGADIVKQLGGAEVMAKQLSETLKVRVIVHV